MLSRCDNFGRALFLLLVLLVSGCRNAAPAVQADESVGTVTVRILVEDKDPIEVQVPDVGTGATLESVMQQIDQPAIEISGSGTTAFVKSIDGKNTEGSSGWTFEVDGEFASQGIGQTKLSPPTTVEWSYGGFE